MYVKNDGPYTQLYKVSFLKFIFQVSDSHSNIELITCAIPVVDIMIDV